jgi:DNA invertase Pin-like site-specific DNA recombinase
MSTCNYCHQNPNTITELGVQLCKECHKILSDKRPTNAKPKHNAFIYLRVSTKAQDDADSGLFIQNRQAIEYCFENNLMCLGIYQDVHSAWNMKNTGLIGLHQMIRNLGFDLYLPHKCRSKNPLVSKLRQAIKNASQLLLIENPTNAIKSHIDYIVVANVDRLGRDVKNLLSIKSQLQAHRTLIVSACQHIQTGNDLGDFRFHREALEAELFSRDRSMRVKSVKSAKKALGNFMGGCPAYGMKVVKVNGVRKVEPDSEEQKVISMIRWVPSVQQAIKRLKSKGITKRGRAWTPALIRSIRHVRLEAQMSKLKIEDIDMMNTSSSSTSDSDDSSDSDSDSDSDYME